MSAPYLLNPAPLPREDPPPPRPPLKPLRELLLERVTLEREPLEKPLPERAVLERVELEEVQPEERVLLTGRGLLLVERVAVPQKLPLRGA